MKRSIDGKKLTQTQWKSQKSSILPSPRNLVLITRPWTKVIHPKYSIDCVCSKMLNNGLFLSLFKLIPCHIHWIGYVLAYFNSICKFLSSFNTAHSAQTHKSISFISIVWSTLYVYLCLEPQLIIPISA